MLKIIFIIAFVSNVFAQDNSEQFLGRGRSLCSHIKALLFNPRSVEKDTQVLASQLRDLRDFTRVTPIRGGRLRFASGNSINVDSMELVSIEALINYLMSKKTGYCIVLPLGNSFYIKEGSVGGYCDSDGGSLHPMPVMYRVEDDCGSDGSDATVCQSLSEGSDEERTLDSE